VGVVLAMNGFGRMLTILVTVTAEAKNPKHGLPTKMLK
jgi:hypothetical protein